MKALTVLLTLILITACNALPQPPNATATPTTFSGYYTSAFETSAFLPCDKKDGGLADTYWLSAAAETNFFEQLTKLNTPTHTDPTPAPYTPKTVFAKFEGKLSPPGKYGHLGMYSREITVTKLIEIAPANGQCG